MSVKEENKKTQKKKNTESLVVCVRIHVSIIEKRRSTEGWEKVKPADISKIIYFSRTVGTTSLFLLSFYTLVQKNRTNKGNTALTGTC